MSEQIHGPRSPLHVAADWPGHFPIGPATVRLLIEAGADPNAVVTDGTQAETPLHWAASSDDADVAEALINGGADIEMAGGSIGTPLDNAVGYGCWNVARLLVQRGARVSKLWHAAALGLMPQVEKFLAASPARHQTTSPRPSGKRATEGSGGPPSACWPAEPIRTPPRLQRPDGRSDRCRAWYSAREPRDLAARPFAVTTARARVT